MRAVATPERARWPAALAATGLACMLVVIAASSYIRLGSLFPAVADAVAFARGAHRVAASLAGMAVFALAWLAYRGRAPSWAAYAALGVTFLLAGLGAAFGTTPSPAAALGNVVGGLALAALLAWVLARAAAARTAANPPLAHAAFYLGCVQAALGAWIGTRPEEVGFGTMSTHVALGAAVALLAGWLGVRLAASGARMGLAMLALAAATPLAGAISAFFEPPAELALLHPVAAALLLAMLSYSLARLHERP